MVKKLLKLLENKKPVKQLLIIISVVWLMFVSLVPRSTEVLNKNPIFLLDQGRDYLAVKDIIIGNKLTLIGAEVGSGMAGLSGLFHGPFYFYFLSIPTLFFGSNPYGGLLLMFLFGLLTIVMGFILGKKVFGIFGGLILAMLIALSPPIIAQSRFVWSPHLSSFFILLAFYFIYLAYKKKNLHLFLSAFFVGILYNFEFAIAVPMALSLMLYSILTLRKAFKKFIFILLGLITAYLPLIIFEFRHSFQAIKGLFSYLSSSSALIVLKFDSFAFLHNFSDTFAKQTIFPPVLILVIFIAGFIVFTLKERKAEVKSFIMFLLLLTAVTIVISLGIKTHIFEYYLIHLNFVYVFIFSYLIFCSFARIYNSLRLLFTMLLFIFVISGTINGVNTFVKDLKDHGGMTKIKGKLEVIDYIYQDAGAQKFGLLIFAPPVYTYPYDYLIWWKGTKKYNYLPHQEKKGIVYLLIEPDKVQPWTYKGWLETVVETGKVLETVELPSGFIVQKRIF